jgi:hypothetical protein
MSIIAIRLQVLSCASPFNKIRTISKCHLQEIALPVFYSRVHIATTSSLEKFYSRLHAAEQKWDSIRRIPYSSPGRWVQILNLSALRLDSHLPVDSLLTQLFPVIPFLSRLTLPPTYLLSRRAMTSLAYREGSVNIQVLEGINYAPMRCPPDEDPLVQLLRSCPNVEQLEVINSDTEWEALPGLHSVSTVYPFDITPLDLPHLHTMTLLSMPYSPLLLCLLHSPLPSLAKLTVTPYDDIPYPASLVSQFISMHGEKLRSLLLFTPRTWPTILRPSPPTLLQTSPNLKHLSLEIPLPRLVRPTSPASPHPIQIISIPRPNADFWKVLERLLPFMPSLRAIRVRDLRWLRPGMTPRAQEAGVQGELREWRRRLAPRGIRVLDADWKMSE